MKEFKYYLKKFWWSYFVFIYVVNSLTSCYHSTMYAIRDNKQNYFYNIQKEEKKEDVHTFEEYKKEHNLGEPFYKIENYEFYIIKNDINAIDNIPIKILYANTDKETQDLKLKINTIITNNYIAHYEYFNKFYPATTVYNWDNPNPFSYDLEISIVETKKYESSYYTYINKTNNNYYTYSTKSYDLIWKKGIPEKSDINLVAQVNGRSFDLPTITLE